MTIFDTLKYPISNPPTIEQLEALPHHVYLKLRKRIGFGHHVTPKHMHEYLTVTINSFHYQEQIDYLRLLISRMR